VIGGLIAAAIFKRLYRALAGQDQAPPPTAQDTSWRQLIIASTIKGALSDAVKGATDRTVAASFAHLTGTWPDGHVRKPTAK
jgi:hypothetical protein